MAKAAHWLDTDAEVRKRGEQTGLDTLVVHAVNDECQTSDSMLFGVTPNGLSIPPGCTVARLKLKGIDGGPHKRWSMWFNSKQRAEPYQPLTWASYFPEMDRSVRLDATQVLHGCRQLVS